MDAAALVSGWEALCQLLSPAFTRPTYLTFLHVVTGWALCRSKPMVTNLVCTVGSSLLGHAAKHWTVYEKFFYRAAWSLSDVSHLLLTRVVVPLLIDRRAVSTEIDLDLDDTTASRCGKHVAWAGYFKDASVSNTLRTVVHWAHNWVIGAVAMRDRRWPKWVIGLPVLFALYRKPADCDDKVHPFLTRQQIAARMVHQVRDALPGRTIRVAADGQYATTHVVSAASDIKSNLVSRMRSDAAIYALPPKRKRSARGRRRKKGRRLPTPKQLAARRKIGWRTVEVLSYGGQLVERQAPLALIVQTLVKAWYLLYGVDAVSAQPKGPAAWGWMQEKDHPSYLDMLATLRRVLWTHRIKCNSTLASRVRRLLEPLRFTLCAAA